MDEVKRLSRKPGSTAVWLTLLLLSALLLQLGFSLFYSMFTLAIDIEALYTTIAVPSDYAPVVETAYGEGRGSAEFTDEQIELLKSAEGVVLMDDPQNTVYPTPLECADRDEVFVGRVRLDPTVPSGINMWVVADNIRKGAATNAVQIAERIIAKAQAR